MVHVLDLVERGSVADSRAEKVVGVRIGVESPMTLRWTRISVMKVCSRFDRLLTVKLMVLQSAPRDCDWSLYELAVPV